MTRKKYILYGITIALLAVLTIWVFHKPDYLEELKEKKNVPQGEEKEAMEVASMAVNALAANDLKAWRKQLFLGRDPQMRERIEEFVLGDDPFTPADVLGCDRLKVSHRKDNVQVYIYSRPRKKYYVFAMIRNQDGQFQIMTIGGADKRSAQKFLTKEKK